MKIGDKAKGFEFTDQMRSKFIAMTSSMYNLIGVEGTIVEINYDQGGFLICFGFDYNGQAWWYPIDEYMKIQREERLNELGI